jgi:hypothetical protein
VDDPDKCDIFLHYDILAEYLRKSRYLIDLVCPVDFNILFIKSTRILDFSDESKIHVKSGFILFIRFIKYNCSRPICCSPELYIEGIGHGSAVVSDRSDDHRFISVVTRFIGNCLINQTTTYVVKGRCVAAKAVT